MRNVFGRTGLGLLAVLGLLQAAPLHAQTQSLKIAIPQKGNWDTSFVEFGNRLGWFKEQRLDVEQIYTQGGSQTMQAVISGSVDIAMATGTLGVIGAFSKGAPVRIISAEATGASDLFWYALPDSGIASLKDANGKTIAFSEPGSSSNLVLLGLIHQFGVNAKPVPVGGVPASLTQVESHQIDIGWSAVPFNLQAVDDKKLVIVVRGSEAKEFQNQTIRVNFTNQSVVQNRKDALDRFNRVYDRVWHWAYSDPKATEMYAQIANIPLNIAQQAVHDFLPQQAMQPYEVKGMAQNLQQAYEFKFTPRQLTEADVKPLLADVMQPAK